MAYIAGDVHLGGPDGAGGRFAPWLDWLALQPPARLVLLGDIFEFWVEHDSCVRAHHHVLERMRRLRDLGWRIDLVQGNRELVAGRRLECLAGSRLLRRLDLVVSDRVIRIVHGDQLIHDPGYRTYRAFMLWFPVVVHRLLHPGAMHAWVARLLRRRAQRRRDTQPQHRAHRRRIFLDPRRVRATARGADLVIAGHIHQHWRRTIGGIDLSLVGDWPHAGGHWIEIGQDGALVARSLPA